MSSALATARAVFDGHNKAVVSLQAKLKEALAARAVAAKVVAREAARAEREKLSKPVPLKAAKATKATTAMRTVKKSISKQHSVCAPCAPAKRRRPAQPGCNACRRLLDGYKSFSKPHTCGKVLWAR